MCTSLQDSHKCYFYVDTKKDRYLIDTIIHMDPAVADIYSIPFRLVLQGRGIRGYKRLTQIERDKREK